MKNRSKPLNKLKMLATISIIAAFICNYQIGAVHANQDLNFDQDRYVANHERSDALSW